MAEQEVKSHLVYQPNGVAFVITQILFEPQALAAVRI